MLSTSDFTIRYEGQQWALYQYGITLSTGKRSKTYLGTYRHKQLAVKARDERFCGQTSNSTDR